MDKELITLLNNWKISDKNYFKAIRNVRYKPSPIAAGEFLVLIQSVLQINHQTISMGRLFLTFAQSDSPFIKNKIGDVYRLTTFLKTFDEDFNSEVQKILGGNVDESDESDYQDL